MWTNVPNGFTGAPASLIAQIVPPPGDSRTHSKSDRQTPPKANCVTQADDNVTRLDDAHVQALSYYHGLLPREDVETLLKKNGEFALRKTEVHVKGTIRSCEEFILSVFWSGKVKHHRIQQDTLKQWALDEVKRFERISDLIDFYKGQKVMVKKDGGKLVTGVGRQSWQLTHEQIRLGDELGQGAFGIVYRGQMIDGNKPLIPVAVKVLKKDVTKDAKDQRKVFISEARMLRSYDHPNIVKFYGIACQREPVMIAMELADTSLDSCLKEKGRILSLLEKCRFCMEASAGMAYLETKKVVHRDVAARNCLLSGGLERKLKITDFGLSMNQSVSSEALSGERMPIKWLSPEAIMHKQFSHASDVWAFGILLHEVFSNCRKQPYDKLRNAEVKSEVCKPDGYRMDPPSDMPKSIATIMRSCWEFEPKRRPTFKKVHSGLKSLYDEHLKKSRK